MRITVLFLILFASISSCAWLKEHEYDGDYNDTNYEIESRGSGMPSEPGKCYAKCLIQDQYEDEEISIFEYNGTSPSETDGVELESIIVKYATTEWEKKKSDRNCQSKNPEDCLIWCLVEVPEEIQDFYVVSDTSLLKEYEIKSISRRILIEAGGFTEWKEIMCAADVTPNIYRNIQIALNNAGFDLITDGKVGPKTKNALVKFQKDNGLPVGGLDIETIKALGVNR